MTNMFFLIVAIGIVVIGVLVTIDILSGIDRSDDIDMPAEGKTIYNLYDDYPEYHLNKSNIADAINYNPIVQEALKPYHKICFEIGIDRYTLHLEENTGKYEEIIVGLDEQCDFTVTSTREEFNTLIDDAKKGKIGDLLAEFVTMDVPMSVKTKTLEIAKGYGR